MDSHRPWRDEASRNSKVVRFPSNEDATSRTISWGVAKFRKGVATALTNNIQVNKLQLGFLQTHDGYIVLPNNGKDNSSTDKIIESSNIPD